MQNRRLSIRKRLRRYFVAIAIIPIALFLLAALIYTTVNIWESTNDDLQSRMQRISENMDQVLQEGFQIGKTVSEDSTLLDELTVVYDGSAARYASEGRINNRLCNISRYFDERIQVYVLGENGAQFKSGSLSIRNEDFRQSEWYLKIRGNREATWFPPSRASFIVKSFNERFITLGLPLYTKGGNGFLGVLLVEIRVNDILDEIRSADDNFYIIVPNLKMQIIDERVQQYENDQVIVFSEDGIELLERWDEKPEYAASTMNRISYWRDDFAPMGILNASTYKLCYTMLDTNQWILVNCVPIFRMYRTPLTIFALLLLSMGVILVAVIVASEQASRTVTQPIITLNRSAHSVGEGNFDVVIEKTNDDEIGDLSDQFNRMTRHIKQLMDRILEEQQVQRKYEFLLLQAQINPHFLYNTLDSIVWLVRMHRDDDAEIMLEALIAFFKTGLNKGHDTIRLEEEIRNVDSYMTIQKYRYKTKLSYEIINDGTLNDLIVPKLILQPLVENAIYHGIKEKDTPGTITVTVRRDGKQAVIEVRDDGLGFKSDELEKMRHNLSDKKITSRESYGIINVRERLELFFREACGMEIESEENVGTCVRIRITSEAQHVIQTDDRR